MAAPFQRIQQNELIRGAARIVYAPFTQPKPARITDVIYLTAGGNATQTLTITGVPTGGTFTLTYDGYTTAAIAYNAAASAVQAALVLLGNIGTGNVTCAGGPLPVSPVTIAFAGTLAAQNIDLLTANISALTGGTPALTIVTTTAGQGLYDPQTGWSELGATLDGITIEVNNTEDAFEVDQVQGNIGTAPNAWTCTVTTKLAEMTLERLQFAWEGSAITTDATPTNPERQIGFAGATQYTSRRVAILFKRSKLGVDKIRAYFFWNCVRAPVAGQIVHAKSGAQQSVAITLNVLADPTVADPTQQFFIIRDQL